MAKACYGWGTRGSRSPRRNLTSAAEQAAAQKARELIEGQPVVLVKDVTERDSAGRLLRYVFSGSRFVNFELAREGLATVLSNSPDSACATLPARPNSRRGRKGWASGSLRRCRRARLSPS